MPVSKTGKVPYYYALDNAGNSNKTSGTVSKEASNQRNTAGRMPLLGYKMIELIFTSRNSRHYHDIMLQNAENVVE